MERIPLKRFKGDLDDTETDIKRCQNSISQALSSTEAGRKRILKAKEIRQDDVNERRKEKDLQEFTYHVSNECYKRYTHKKSLETSKNKALLNNMEELQIYETSCNVTLQNDQRSTRSQVSPRAPPKSYNVDIYRKSCLICGHLKHKGDYEKKVEVFQNVVSEVDAALKRGEGFPLSSLRDRAKISFPIENYKYFFKIVMEMIFVFHHHKKQTSP